MFCKYNLSVFQTQEFKLLLLILKMGEHDIITLYNKYLYLSMKSVN